MTTDVTGIISPVLTPFDDRGELLPERIAESVEYTMTCGCHAVVAAGTGVQETSSLTPAERKVVITETVDAVDGRRPVLAGVSYPAQPVVAELTAHAEREGADGLLAMPPWGITPSPEAVFQYFSDIADSTDLPILVYNNPGVTVDMSRELMARVAREIDGVAYVKESLRDWKKLAWLFEEIHYAGHAEVFATMDVLLPTLQTVGTGVVTPAPLSAPSMAIYDAVEEGDVETAIAVQRTFGSFPPRAADVGLTPVCKAATELAGVPVGPPRSPYQGLDAEGREAIDRWMDEMDVPRVE